MTSTQTTPKKHGSVRAVLFDLDGTLIDSLQDISDCVNRALARVGQPAHDAAAYRYFVGDGVETLVSRAMPDALRTPELLLRVREILREEYAHHWAVKTRVYPGVEDLLAGLLARNIRLSVLSNKPQDLTEKIVRHFFSRWPFSPVWGADTNRPLKPDPAAALEVARVLKLDPFQVVFLGDTDTDLETARAAGMIPAGALWGFRPEQLKAGRAAFLLEQPAELLNYC